MLQEYTSRDLKRQLSSKRFLLEAGAKHALSPEVPIKAKAREKYTVKCSQYTENTCANAAAKTIKNADSNPSFSSINAATKLLGFSHHGFKVA